MSSFTHSHPQPKFFTIHQHTNDLIADIGRQELLQNSRLKQIMIALEEGRYEVWQAEA